VGRSSEPFPVLVLTPPAGRSAAEQWLARGQRAAAADLTGILQEIDGIGPIYALCAESDDQAMLAERGVLSFKGGTDTFQFGEALARFAAEHAGERMAYFGGPSAPLLASETISAAFAEVRQAEKPFAVVNNLHSSDWVILNHCQALTRLTDRLPSDNQLGWILSHEAGFQVNALPPSAESRADIDTPADLLLLKDHHRLGVKLRAVLESQPDAGATRIDRLRRLVSTPGEALGIIGRASSHVWSELERRSEIWVRLFVEERGMLASGRAARGEVRSLIAMAVDEWGAERFVERMGELVGGLIWDTRVWMSHRGPWPPAADRCASDLGWVDEVHDPALRELTRAAASAPMPVLLGGHGVVAGGLYAFLESLESG
jgi:hypothetical protein